MTFSGFACTTVQFPANSIVAVSLVLVILDLTSLTHCWRFPICRRLPCLLSGNMQILLFPR